MLITDIDYDEQDNGSKWVGIWVMLADMSLSIISFFTIHMMAPGNMV
jgi:hypothetical protein